MSIGINHRALRSTLGSRRSRRVGTKRLIRGKLPTVKTKMKELVQAKIKELNGDVA